MILQVQHETRLEYSEPVSEWLTEVRLEPVSDERQSCHSFHLAVSQPVGLFRYEDGFGNRVHHFNLLEPHQQVRILAASVVETAPPPCDPSASRATYPLDRDGLDPVLLDYLRLRPPVNATPRLELLLARLRPPAGAPLGELVWKVSDHIHRHFEYAPDVTHAASPIDDTLAHGKGVCQDFAHLTIALLRSLGVPSRYVSGYIHRPNKASQSHAWCEAWLPDLGWVGIDPTNHCLVGEQFVRVACGRDFTDVPPNKGVYRGRGQETILVRVETQALERLPPLSWKDRLPPLDVPLTAITRRRQRLTDDLDEQQAQQQQQ